MKTFEETCESFIDGRSFQNLSHIKFIEEILKFLDEQPQPEKSGLLYEKFLKSKNKYSFSYRTWQRAIKELIDREKINIKRKIGGYGGTTTFISKK